MHLAGLMMIKNEEKRINVSIESLKDCIDSLVVYDTGSTDNTINILKELCVKYNINLRLKEGEFVNFEISRNISIEFAETFSDIDYLVLLDCNDELRNGKLLRKICQSYKNNNMITSFLTCQKWFSGNQTTKYFNTRVIKNKKGWRFKGAVHEYLKDTTKKENESDKVIKLPEKIEIYQDRTKDDNKSFKRFSRDKEILLEEFQKDPTNTRTIFYLAQTLSCLNEKEEAFKYYKLRSTKDGFIEEKFHAYYKCAELSYFLKKPLEESIGYALKSYEIIERVEPLLFLSLIYKSKGDKDKDKKNTYYNLSHMFISKACDLEYPKDCILFVDNMSYNYKRWHLLSVVSYTCNKFEDGKRGAINALKNKPDSEIDKNINNFYSYKNY